MNLILRSATVVVWQRGSSLRSESSCYLSRDRSCGNITVKVSGKARTTPIHILLICITSAYKCNLRDSDILLPFPGNPDASFHTRFGNFRYFSEQLENDVMSHDEGWSQRGICRCRISSDQTRLRVSPQTVLVVSHPGESLGSEICCSTTVVVIVTTARIQTRSSAPLRWVLTIDRVVATVIPLSSDVVKMDRAYSTYAERHFSW